MDKVDMMYRELAEPNSNAISDTQHKVLSIIPHVTGTLSIIGSCWIIYDILIRRKHKLKILPYHRILMGMSVYDAICSFSLGLATLPIPQGTEDGAVGNTQTCTAQGFFNQLVLGSPLYNLMLAIYYILVGKYHMEEKVVAKRYEKYMHATAILIPTGLALAGLPLTLYNSANLWCWIAAYPPGSEGFNGHHHDSMVCERGHESWIYRWVFFYIPLWAIIVAITVLMILLTKSVKSEEKRYVELIKVQNNDSERKLAEDKLLAMQEVSDTSPIAETTEEASTANPSVHTIPPPPPPTRSDTFNLERSRKMFYQALFYVGAFYLTWWAPTLNRLVQMINGESYFFFMLASAIFAPLQGFLNFLVYRHGPCVA